MRKLLLIAMAATMGAAAQAQIAFDSGADSAYNDGFSNGDDGGSGFGAWNFVATTQGSSLGTVAAGGRNGSGTRAWDQINGGDFTYVELQRSLDVPLADNQTFSLYISTGILNPYPSGQFGQSIGFGLHNAAGAELVSIFTADYVNSWYTAGGGNTLTTFARETTSGFTLSLTQLSSTSVKVDLVSDGGATYTQTRTYGAAGPATRFKFFSYDFQPGAGTDTIFNNMKVEAVPEPATMAVLGLGIAAIVRRRSKKA